MGAEVAEVVVAAVAEGEDVAANPIEMDIRMVFPCVFVFQNIYLDIHPRCD